jgi:hypothetical protein
LTHKTEELQLRNYSNSLERCSRDFLRNFSPNVFLKGFAFGKRKIEGKSVEAFKYSRKSMRKSESDNQAKLYTRSKKEESCVDHRKIFEEINDVHD